MKKIFFLSVISLSFFFFQACNNDGGQGSKQEADSINHANKDSLQAASDFMVDAAIINLTEIKLGGIAQKQAATSRVKDFASMIVEDHKKVNRQLKSLAKDKNVTLPDSLSEEQQKDASDLKSKKGEDFDETFLNDMVKGHKDAINTYKNAADQVQDPYIKQFIENTLPGLQKHLDSAQAIQGVMNGNTTDQMKTDQKNNDETQKGMNQNNFNENRSKSKKENPPV